MAGTLDSGGTLGVAQKKQIKAFSERIVNLLKERADLNESITEVFNEAGEAGFEKKILRKAVKRVMTDAAVLQAEEEMIDSYVEAIQPDLFSGAKAA